MSAPELLPCPFCGVTLEYAPPVVYFHPIGKCILSGRNFPKGKIGQWGKRAPLDPAVLAALPQVRALVEAETERIAKQVETIEGVSELGRKFIAAAIRKGGDA